MRNEQRLTKVGVAVQGFGQSKMHLGMVKFQIPRPASDADPDPTPLAARRPRDPPQLPVTRDPSSRSDKAIHDLTRTLCFTVTRAGKQSQTLPKTSQDKMAATRTMTKTAATLQELIDGNGRYVQVALDAISPRSLDAGAASPMRWTIAAICGRPRAAEPADETACSRRIR